MRRILLLALLCAVASASARATVIVPAAFREVVTGADIIAYGRVVDAIPELTDDRRRVETVVTFQVGTYLKGGPGDTVVFKVPGGDIGRYRTILVGAPTFRPGEEAVLFLNSRDGETPHVFGLNQGVFRVRTDQRTRRRVVVPPPLLARGPEPEAVVRGALSRRPVPLETFGQQVRLVLAEAAASAR